MELRFERLVVLALNLDLGLKLFDLQFKACDFSTKLGQVGAHWARLRWWRWHVLCMSWLLVRIRVARVDRLGRLLRMCRLMRVRQSRRLVLLKSLGCGIDECRRRCKGFGQRAWPSVFRWRLDS